MWCPNQTELNIRTHDHPHLLQIMMSSEMKFKLPAQVSDVIEIANTWLTFQYMAKGSGFQAVVSSPSNIRWRSDEIRPLLIFLKNFSCSPTSLNSNFNLLFHHLLLLNDVVTSRRVSLNEKLELFSTNETRSMKLSIEIAPPTPWCWYDSHWRRNLIYFKYWSLWATLLVIYGPWKWLVSTKYDW